MRPTLLFMVLLYAAHGQADGAPKITTNAPAHEAATPRATWSATKDIKLAIGVDNLNNETYYAYHPMPMRTLHAELQAKF